MQLKPHLSTIIRVAMIGTLGCNFITGTSIPASTTPASRAPTAVPSTPVPAAPETTPTAANTTGQPTDLAWIYEAPYDPINLTPTLDESRLATALIPVEGGTLTATGVDGTTYTLDIPGDALLAETQISLTPVQSLAGLPFGEGTALAVQMAPEGLSFNNFVTLTITPAQPIPLGEQIMFDYQADGRALGLALPALDPNAIQIELLHFSGAGVSKGLLADVEPVRRRLGGDVEARLHSAMAAAVQQARQNGESVDWLRATLIGYLLEFIEKVIEPRIAAAGESCAAGRLAMDTIARIEHYLALLGRGDSTFDAHSELSRLSEIVGPVCLKEEYELCLDQHIAHRIVRVWLSLLRQAQLNGGDSSEIMQIGQEYIEKCLRFDLEFESTAVTEKEGASFESIVKAKVPLRAKFEDIKVTIEGERALVNDSYKVDLPGCKTTPSRGGATFTVLDLTFEALGNVATELGTVKDLRLKYDPGTTTESVAVDCQGLKLTFPGVLWTEAFHATHKDEFGSEGVLAKGWEILGGELYARKEWQPTANLEGGTVTEIGSFKLYHRPGS